MHSYVEGPALVSLSEVCLYVCVSACLHDQIVGQVGCMCRAPAPPVSHCVRPHPPARDPLSVQDQPPLRLNLKKSIFLKSAKK